MHTRTKSQRDATKAKSEETRPDRDQELSIGRSRKNGIIESLKQRMHKYSQKKHQLSSVERPWSRQSYWQSSRHQQQPTSEPPAASDTRGPDQWSRKTYWEGNHKQQNQKQMSDDGYGKESRTFPGDRVEKCDALRQAKNYYMPPEIQTSKQSSWDEKRLYNDVDRAVRQARGRSG